MLRSVRFPRSPINTFKGAGSFSIQKSMLQILGTLHRDISDGTFFYEITLSAIDIDNIRCCLKPFLPL